MIKQGGEWQTVDWQTALEYVAHGLKQHQAPTTAPQSIGALASAAQHGRGAVPARPSWCAALGSENIDYRLRHARLRAPPKAAAAARWLGTPIASLSTLQRVLVVGSFLRKDHPLFALRLRAGGAQGRASVTCIHAVRRRLADADRRAAIAAAPSDWVAGAGRRGRRRRRGQGRRRRRPQGDADRRGARPSPTSLLAGERKAILLGNAAAQHPQAAQLLRAGPLDRRADRRRPSATSAKRPTPSARSSSTRCRARAA